MTMDERRLKEEFDQNALYGRLVDFVIDLKDTLQTIEERKRLREKRARTDRCDFLKLC